MESAAYKAGMEINRPLLQWHGGKWALAQWIISFFPERHHVYVEPFGGAASVLIQKPKCHTEVYNDLDQDVVNLFRVLRSEQAETLVRMIELTPFAREEFRLAWQQSFDPIERARQLVIRSFMGHGTAGPNMRKTTGFRSNAAKAGSSPAADWKSYPTELRKIIDRLKDVVVESQRALTVMDRHDSERTLFYLDPPYLPETRDAGFDYTAEMTRHQHQVMLRAITRLKGMVLLSGYRSEVYERMLPDWTCYTRRSHADGGREREECLWLNPAAEKSRRNPDLLKAHDAELNSVELPSEFGPNVPYEDLRKMVMERTGVEKGWQMMFSRFADVNIMTVQTWRQRGFVPPGYLHKAAMMTPAARSLLEEVRWTDEMRARVRVLISDGKRRSLQQIADQLSEEFEQPVTVSSVKGAKFRAQQAVDPIPKRRQKASP